MLYNRHTVRITLENGVTLEGYNPTEVLETARKLGYKGDLLWYYSESKRTFVKISEMDTRHIYNAIGKMFNRIADEEWDYDFTIKILTSPQLRALLEEYVKRDHEEEIPF